MDAENIRNVESKSRIKGDIYHTYAIKIWETYISRTLRMDNGTIDENHWVEKKIAQKGYEYVLIPQ